MTVPKTIALRGKKGIRKAEMKEWVAQGEGPLGGVDHTDNGVAAGMRASSHSSCDP